jgi:hypothetical protein
LGKEDEANCSLPFPSFPPIKKFTPSHHKMALEGSWMQFKSILLAEYEDKECFFVCVKGFSESLIFSGK